MRSAPSPTRWRGRATAAGTARWSSAGRSASSRRRHRRASASSSAAPGSTASSGAPRTTATAARGPLRTGHLSSPWVVAQARCAGPGRPRRPSHAGPGHRRRRLRQPARRDAPAAGDDAAAPHRTCSIPTRRVADGPLRLTAVTAGARRFWPALPRLLTGRYSAAMTPDNGYLSGRLRTGPDHRPRRLRARRRALRHRPGAAGRDRPRSCACASSADELGLDPHPHLGAEPRRPADARRLCARLSGTQRRGDRRRPPRRADGRPRPVDAAVDAEPGDEEARPAAVAAGAGGDARRRVPRPAAERDGAAVAGDRADLPEGRARAARQPAGRLHRRPHRDRPAPGAGARRHGGALAALPAAVGRTDVERGGDRGAARVRGVPARRRDGGDAAQLADLSRHRPVDLVAGRPRRGAGRRRAAGAAAGADPRLAPRRPAPDDAAQGAWSRRSAPSSRRPSR